MGPAGTHLRQIGDTTTSPRGRTDAETQCRLRGAGAGRTPVDDAGELAVAHETVALEITLRPHVRADIGGRSERCFPHGNRGLGVDQVACALDGTTGRLVVLDKGPCPVPSGRGAVGANGLKPADDVGEIEREPDGVIHPVDLAGCQTDSGETDNEIIAHAIHGVVGAPRLDLDERQVESLAVRAFAVTASRTTR
jgi:hypothetical protein